MMYLLLLCLIAFVESINTDFNCSYGTLTNGGLAWGLNMKGKPIPGSSQFARNGSSSIQMFNTVWYNFSSFIVCVAPLSRNGKIINNGDNCDYGLLNGGVATWGLNNNRKRITSTIIAQNGSDSINAFTRLMNENCKVIEFCFEPLEPLEVESNCSYGALANGALMWGLDMKGRPIRGSSILTYTGQETIQAFNKLWYNLSSFIIHYLCGASTWK